MLPRLPDLSSNPSTLARVFGNPTRSPTWPNETWRTYWVVDGHILAGGCPGDARGKPKEDDPNEGIDSRLRRLLLQGPNLESSLLDDEVHGCPEQAPTCKSADVLPVL
jgi:hypothetical protein